MDCSACLAKSNVKSAAFVCAQTFEAFSSTPPVNRGQQPLRCLICFHIHFYAAFLLFSLTAFWILQRQIKLKQAAATIKRNVNYELAYEPDESELCDSASSDATKACIPRRD